MSDDIKPMTAKELVARIESNSTVCEALSDVVTIPVKRLGMSIGGQPCVPIMSAHRGFDWDAGKLILQPKEPLISAAGIEDERKRMRDLTETIGWIHNILRSATPDDQKLKNIEHQIKFRRTAPESP